MIYVLSRGQNGYHAVTTEHPILQVACFGWLVDLFKADKKSNKKHMVNCYPPCADVCSN